MKRPIALLSVAAMMALGLVAASGPTQAKVPGPNGEVLFLWVDPAIDAPHVFIANPDGTHEHEPRRDPEPNRVLATALFTDIVGSSTRAAEFGDVAWHELLERHHHAVREELSKFGGVEQDTAGDGFFAAFDGPARAVRCAQAIVEAVRSLGLEVRIGLHTGECEVLDGKVSGIATITGARVMAEAHALEILVSRTVKDLVAGSGLSFEDAGEHELKGIPDRWHLYRVLE